MFLRCLPWHLSPLLVPVPEESIHHSRAAPKSDATSNKAEKMQMQGDRDVSYVKASMILERGKLQRQRVWGTQKEGQI